MLCGLRCRAYPTDALQAHLRRWVGHQRFIQNAKTSELAYFRAFARSALSLTGRAPLPDQAYSQFITEQTAFLREVPSQVLRNGAYRFATATARMLKGLGSAPAIRKKHGRQSVLLTSELFRFIDFTDPASGEVRQHLILGTKAHPLGRLHFKAHRAFEVPKMLSVSVQPDGRWFVSFCFEAPGAPGAEEFILRDPQELAYEFGMREDLDDITVGIDRGVVLPLALSTGQTFELSETQKERIEEKARRVRRYQRQMARQAPNSKNRNKTRSRIARLVSYGREVRQDFAHKASRALVDSPAEVFVVEDLKLANMTAAPAPRQDAAGRYTANGAAAKAGLNKAILSSALGLTKQFLAYKAARCNKLVLPVSPYNSSNECARCAHISKESRVSQALFRCVACGHTDNADHNAACVLKERGMLLLVSGEVRFKTKKTARVRGLQESKVGPVRPEPGGHVPPIACGELCQTPEVATPPLVQRSLMQEAATSAA